MCITPWQEATPPAGYSSGEVPMFATILILHSWLRWFVLFALVARIGVAGAAWAQGRTRSGIDKGIGIATVAILDLQLLIGLTVYGTSPTVRGALQNMGAAMKDSTLRFWAVEHISMMILAVVIAHIAQALAKKATDDAKSHRIALIGNAIALITVLAAIPWPFREGIGRALFQLG